MHLQADEFDIIENALLDTEGGVDLKALALIEKAKQGRADATLRDAALDRVMREWHATDEIEIDDDAGTSQADNGTWVQAWIWVPQSDDEA